MQVANDFGFRYAVNDFNGNEHSHQQQRNGNAVTGQYKVLLPDGRLQTVTYIADAAGYRAKVDYTPATPGEATTAGLNTAGSTNPLSILPANAAVAPAVLPVAPGVLPVNPGVLPVNPALIGLNAGVLGAGSLYPAGGSVYPGQFGYPPFPVFRGAGSYGSGLTFSTPRTTLAVLNGFNGYRPPLFKRDLTNYNDPYVVSKKLPNNVRYSAPYSQIAPSTYQ